MYAFYLCFNDTATTDIYTLSLHDALPILPELCTSGYAFESEDEARALAQPPEGGALADWAEEAAAGDAVVVGGFAEEGEDGLLYNSAAVVDSSGVVAVYRKLHLWDREKLVFEPGREPA